MEWSVILIAVVFSVVALIAVALIPVGLPGTWLMLALAAGLEWLDSDLLGMPGHETFGWPTLAIGATIAVAGEVLEAGAGAAGTRAGGGTPRGMLGAILGGLIGAIALTPLIPIPIVGTLVGAFLGTFAGAFYAEMTGPEAREAGMPLRAAVGAALGRLAGTLGKLVFAVVIWVMLGWAAFTA